MASNEEKSRYRERVYEIVRRIPRGRVMTYGQISELLGEGDTPRTVGFAMHSCPEGTPWQRVLNAQGACSTGRIVLPQDKQQRLLEIEGVVFNDDRRCELKTFLWIPDDNEAVPSRSAAKTILFKRKSSTRGAKR